MEGTPKNGNFGGLPLFMRFFIPLPGDVANRRDLEEMNYTSLLDEV